MVASLKQVGSPKPISYRKASNYINQNVCVLVLSLNEDADLKLNHVATTSVV